MKYKKFKKYAGLVEYGVMPQQPVNMESSHLSRAGWLTAEVESGGCYGTVMNYDGTGMTAGIHQAIAVYPRQLEDDRIDNDQGPLWKLLVQMRTAAPNSYHLVELFSRMLNWGWYLDNDGVVRHQLTGVRVSGQLLRDGLSGPGGVVPTKGKGRIKANEWANAFYRAFSDVTTFHAQNEFGLAHFTKRAKVKMKPCSNQYYRRFTLHDYLYGPHLHISNVKYPWESVAMDLAICMFWSHTVNAPGKTLRVLCSDVDSWGLPGKDYTPGRETARRIIALLGNNPYGRWDDDIKHGRYQRTRDAAMEVWPENLFEGDHNVMPKDIPDWEPVKKVK
jgi:hypothetical protein